MSQLRKLWCDNNQLEALPEEVGDCVALQVCLFVFAHGTFMRGASFLGCVCLGWCALLHAGCHLTLAVSLPATL